jgi:hypothetical protein
VNDAPDLRRYHAWLHREQAITPYYELWAAQPNHPARAPLERLAAKAGRDHDIDHCLVRTLLGDLVHAAGGVEYHAGRVLAELDRSQSTYDAYITQYPDLARRPEAWRRAVATEESLAWDYPNLLTWLRSVEERIERGVPGRPVWVGLLPAIGGTSSGST